MKYVTSSQIYNDEMHSKTPIDILASKILKIEGKGVSISRNLEIQSGKLHLL